MSTLGRESFGTALGPYTGADLGEWHRADLVEQAERARLAHEASPVEDARGLPVAPRARRVRTHRRPHLRRPALHSH